MVSDKYQSVRDNRRAKFRSLVAGLGFSGRGILRKVTGLSHRTIISGLSDSSGWRDESSHAIEAAMGVDQGFLDDGAELSPPDFPIVDLAGLKVWLLGSTRHAQEATTAPWVKITDVMRLLSGAKIKQKSIALDRTLPAGRLVAVTCIEGCPAPLQAGDIAVFSMDEPPSLGLPVLAYIPRSGCVVRRYQVRQTTNHRVVELAAANHSYPSFKIKSPEDGQILGSLVQLRRIFTLT